MCKFLPKPMVLLVPSFFVLIAAARLSAPVMVAKQQPAKPLKSWTATASWYGPGFDGRPTASGQIYDMNAATAAHPWLPLGSVIRVVNLSNGESQVAMINDRGPYIGDRELDVSYLIASRLGILEPGTANVRIELLEQPQRHPPSP
jgi:rare lipoprotein A